MEWEDAVKLCEEITKLCDEVPEEGEDFADSVAEKALGIQDWIETNKHCTPKQAEALQNMKSGLLKWTERG